MVFQIMTKRVDVLNQVESLERQFYRSSELEAEIFFVKEYKYNPGYVSEKLRLFRLNSDETKTLITTNQFETT